MPKKPPAPPVGPSVGERRNYNFQDPGNYTLWPGVNIAFNSYHQDFSDAERAIEFSKEKIPTGELYNVFGETVDVHTADHGGGQIVTVAQVRVLTWSMQSS